MDSKVSTANAHVLLSGSFLTSMVCETVRAALPSGAGRTYSIAFRTSETKTQACRLKGAHYRELLRHAHNYGIICKKWNNRRVWGR